jgi:predicted dehydrogenase
VIRAAIVGLGRWGRNLVESVQGKSERLRFTHAVVRRPAEAAEFAARHALKLSDDFGGMLADKALQAVVLTTPHSQHVDQIVAAAKAGKAVFCEKPLALTRADARRAVDACRRAGVALGLGYNRRFWPSMLELERIVRGGELGEILHLEGHFSNESTRRFYQGWRESEKDAPAAGMTATGVHVLDSFIWLAGPARLVAARLTERDPEPAPVDTLAVFFEFESRASGVLCGVRSTAQFWRVHVFGSRGSAEALEDTEVVVRVTDAPLRRIRMAPVDALRVQLEAFAASVQTGEPFPIPAEEEMVAGVAAFEAIVTSLAEKRAIELSR